MKTTRWIIDFDYDADPDLPSDVVRSRLNDQVTGTQGQTVVEGNRVTCDNSHDAMWLKLRFSDNIRAIERA